MADSALEALIGIFGCPCLLGVVPARLAFISLGVILGLALGAIPGLGGIVGMAVLLPFTFVMDPHAALGMLVGLMSVAATSDTIPAVLFGIPGTAASMATILDGYPMAKKGEAGRAFGAAFSASMVGGVIGALLLGISVPLLRPVVLAFSTPEFFMLGIMGITMVAAISGRAPGKGLAAGALGLMAGMVGLDPISGIPRWTFNQLYLWDGIPIVVAALGLFGIPELVDVLIKGKTIAETGRPISNVVSGIRDTGRHWFLAARSGVIGTWIGAIPGLGAAVTDWLVYGHARQTVRGARESFGTGDVRGVIAPEGANNATAAGSLVPTLVFGVPGSAGMALIMGALLIQGVQPGPRMLDENLDLTFTIIWSVPIANILGASICLLFAKHMAKLSTVSAGVLFPLIIACIFLAAFQASASYGDLVVLVTFALLGWLMKGFGWPRPPLLLGLVLSPIIERNLFISFGRHGLTFLGRPIVLIMAAITVLTLVTSTFSVWKDRRMEHAR